MDYRFIRLGAELSKALFTKDDRGRRSEREQESVSTPTEAEGAGSSVWQTTCVTDGEELISLLWDKHLSMLFLLRANTLQCTAQDSKLTNWATN